MKKKLLFLITAVVLLALAFSGCGKTTPTRMYRWDAKEGQTLVYDVTLITESNSIAPSSLTSSGYSQAEYRLGLYNALKSKDEKEPLAISGTYTVNIRESEESSLINVYTEVLTANITYSLDDIGADFLQELEASSLEIVDKTETAVTIKTTVTSKTAFYPGTLKPVDSERTVQSVYIGEKAKAVNDYKISCKYVTEGSKYFCEYTFVNNLDPSQNEEGRFSFGNSDASPAYDNNLFFLAPRLYESSEVMSGVSYSVIEPLQKKGVATFSLGGYSDNTLQVGNVTVYKASIYMTTLNGTQFSMAVDTQQKKTIDLSASRNTYIPLMIQQDWLLFTLQEEYIPADAKVAPAE